MKTGRLVAATIFFTALFTTGGLPGVVHATAFTTACGGTACNWNAGTSWSGGNGSNWPSSASDTATIASGDTIVVPSGVAIDVGTTTSGSGSGITVNGMLTWDGPVSVGSNFTLTVNGGGTLDAGDQTFTPGSGTMTYVFNGSAGNRATVTSNPAGAAFGFGTAEDMNIDATYTDFSNLGTSDFGWSRAQSDITQIFLHNTVTESAHFGIDNDCNGTNVGFDIEYNDFRDPSPSNPISSGAYQPFVQDRCAIGTNPRIFANNTFSTASSNSGIAWVQAPGTVVSNNVFSDWAVALAPSTADTSITLNGNFFGNQSSYGEFFESSDGYNAFNSTNGNYFYYVDGGSNHPFGFLPAALSAAAHFTNDILEDAAPSNVSAWWLWSTLTTDVHIDHEIMIAPGGFMVFTNQISPPLLTVNNNTIYSNSGAFNQGSTDCAGAVSEYPMLLWGENLAQITSGTTQLYNNLVVIPDTTQTRAFAVDFKNGTPDQISLLDYNAGWGYPAGALSPPVAYNQNCVSASSGDGPHDFSANPEFVDKTRDLASWDASLGGPGTAADAITQMLKLNGTGGTFNSSYTPANAVAYVQTGFTPQNDAFQATGYGGADIGAENISATPPTLSNGAPSGTLPAGTTSTTLSLTTNENAVCRYGTIANTAFDTIANTFTTTGTTTSTTDQSTTISGLGDGQSYTYYVRCADAFGNATSTDLVISFSVGNPISSSPPLGGGGSGPSTTKFVTTNPSATSTATVVTPVRAAATSSPASTTPGNTSTAIPPPSYTFTKNEQLWDAGEQIIHLQQFLNSDGFLLAQSGPGSPGEETDFFGLRTYEALVKFQRAHGLPATGFFGPLTRAAFEALSATI